MSPETEIGRCARNLEKYLRVQRKSANIRFEDFLGEIAARPERSLRNIFQLFHDMFHYYIPEGYNEYPNDPESINYIHYDTGRLFVWGHENPFFADRLLANRLMNVADSLKEGAVKNKMLLFIGPPGSGKSTFLNNLLRKLELYTMTDEGSMYETIWQLDMEKFGLPYIPNVMDKDQGLGGVTEERKAEATDRYLMVPCPNHDHPIVQVPRDYRQELLDEIIDDNEFKKSLFTRREFAWVFEKEACPVCSSLWKALGEKLPPEDIFAMLYAKRYEFSRKMGHGVSVFSPGDKVNKAALRDAELQKWLDALFKTSGAVNYVYSRLAKTNNGVFAIMDVKSNNVDRIKNIHGVISDGVHKVGDFEESVQSLFLTLINPEDTNVIYDEKSFRDRVVDIPIPYIRDYNTEAEIYVNRFGKTAEEHFLPRVLKSFARVIVSSRLNPESKIMKEWIPRADRYSKFCDKNLLLLKMEIFTGHIPFWLEEGDVKRLDRDMRRRVIAEGEMEGRSGFSGRESIEMFNAFYSRLRNRDELIGMKDVMDFFQTKKYAEKIPAGFLQATHNWYDYIVLQEVKESMFFYNKEAISKDIQDYLFAISNDVGADVISPFSGKPVHVTEDYMKTTELRILGSKASDKAREEFRDDTLKKYVSRALQDVKGGGALKETELYVTLLKRYNQNLKENVLAPFVGNENFRRAILDYGEPSFKTYDRRVRDEVNLLLRNLRSKFHYSEKGARQICLYSLDNKLHEKF